MTIKKACVFVGAGLLAGLGVADTVDWTGESGASYTDAANWTVRGTEEHRVPLNTDVIVFSPGVGMTISVDCSGVTEGRHQGITRFGTIRVESGRVNMTADGNIDFCATANVTNVLDVADGAYLDMGFAVYPTERKKCWIRKTGGGDVYLNSAYKWYDTSYIFEGAIVDGGALRETYYYGNFPLFRHVDIADGALFKRTSYASAGENDIVYDVQKGGRLELSITGPALKYKAITGSGDVEFYDVSGSGFTTGPNLAGGPYRFSGTIRQEKTACDLGFVNYLPNANCPAETEAERHFIIDGSNVFPNLSAFGAMVTPDFGRGIGTFYLPPIYAAPGVKYVLEDEDGEPIRLYANLSTSTTAGRSTGAATVEMEGAGDWFVRSGTSTITGNQVRVTGTVGTVAGATLNLGNGTDAAADMSELPFAAIENEGTLNVKNVNAATLAALSGSGAVNVYSPLTVGSLSLDLTTSVNVLTVDGGNLTVQGGEGAFQESYSRLKVINGGKLKLSGRDTLFCAAWSDRSGDLYSSRRPGYLYMTSDANSLIELSDGATLRAGRYDVKLPDIRLVNGGRLVFLDGVHWRSADGATLQEVYSDGGVIGLYGLEGFYNYTFPCADDADKWVAKVGPGGLKLRYDESNSGRSYSHLIWNDYLKTETADGLETDGGVEIDAAGEFLLYRPQNVKGPFVLRDGNIFLSETLLDRCQAGDFPCGAGDLVFNGGWLSGGKDMSTDRSVNLAGGVGAKVIVRSASRFDLDARGESDWTTRTKALDVTLGPADAAASALVSEEGAVLYVMSEVTKKVDGSNKTRLFVNGGVDTYADGRTKVPVVVAAGLGDAQLATYDAEKGLVAFSNYAAGLSEAGANGAVKIDAATTAPAGTTQVGALLVDEKTSGTYVTIPSGSTLQVGNGTDPAVVAIAPRSGDASFTTFTGAGTLDFGTSRGVFASGCRSNYTYTRTSKIQTKISGSNGVTFSAMAGLNMSINYWDNVNYTVGAANDYEGGTVVDQAAVQVTDPLAFSDGPVEVLGGKMFGGAVCFSHVGPFDNDFTINGYGRRLESWGDLTQAGALEAFVPDVRITGRVNVASHSRIASPQLEDGKTAFIFEGPVSGAELEIFGKYPSTATAPDLANRRTKVVFTQDNASLTGGVTVLNSVVVLRGANPTLGTGRIRLESGTLRFENTAAIDCSNAIAGINATIELGAEKEVKFSGDYSRLESVTLDLCGLRHEFTEIPPFASWTSSDGRATIAIQGGLGTVAWPEGLTLDNAMKFDLEIGEGTVLDLGGQALTVRCGRDGAAKRVVNGTFTELKPQGGMLFLLR